MKTFVVTDLGRFDSAVATGPSPLSHEVLAVDEREDHMQRVAKKVIHAVTDDARDPSVLQALGVRNYDCAMVVVGDDVRNPVLITLNLKETEVKWVICKAQSHVRHKMLEKIETYRVIFPEHEMGIKLAQGLSSSNMLSFIELSEGFGVVETVVPKEWHYKTVQDLDVRARYKVNIIAMHKGKDRALSTTPGASYVIEPGDTVVALGRTEDINHLQDL